MESLTFCSNFPLCFSAYPSSIIKLFCLMNLHYSQTLVVIAAVNAGFTTLWIYTILKPLSDLRAAVGVLLPYGFTLFSNKIPRSSTFQKFYYLMDLHYSQTSLPCPWLSPVFYYLMDLHYSQTLDIPHRLWYSVLLPYGFTLFSNLSSAMIAPLTVLLPYGFTLFSNGAAVNLTNEPVLLPYGFTLFSNWCK